RRIAQRRTLPTTSLENRRSDARRRDRRQTPLHILLRRRPARHADPHRLATLPHRPAAPTLARVLNMLDHAISRRIVAETNEHLVDDHVVEDLNARGAQPFS